MITGYFLYLLYGYHALAGTCSDPVLSIHTMGARVQSSGRHEGPVPALQGLTQQGCMHTVEQHGV